MREVKVKTNAGSIGFVLGMLATLVWAFMGNVLQYNFRRVSLYDALTSDALMSANGLGEASPGGIVLAMIVVLAIFVGGVVGLLFHMAAGTKTVIVDDQAIQRAGKKPKKKESIGSILLFIILVIIGTVAALFFWPI